MVRYRPSRLVIALSAVGTTVGGLVIFKDYVGGCRYYGQETMHGKTVIVTGSNCGIGKEVAREFAKRGAKVIMACRDINKCDKSRQEIVLDSNNGQVYCYKLDLASLHSVRKFAEEVSTKNSYIHFLVNNAAVMRCPHQLTEDGFELQLGVNHLGHFLLTNLLLDELKLSAPSRIINVSSTAHYRGHIDYDDLNSEKHYDAAKAYSQSKLANVLFTKELANRLMGTEVLTFAVNPGIVNTEITRHMSFNKSFFSYILVNPLLWLFSKSPVQGSQTIIKCALSSDVMDKSGKYFSNCVEAPPSVEAQDEQGAKRLWLVSEKWTRLK